MSPENNEIEFEEEIEVNDPVVVEEIEQIVQTNANLAQIRKKVEEYLEKKQTKKEYDDLLDLYDENELR